MITLAKIVLTCQACKSVIWLDLAQVDRDVVGVSDQSLVLWNMFAAAHRGPFGMPS